MRSSKEPVVEGAAEDTRPGGEPAVVVEPVKRSPAELFVKRFVQALAGVWILPRLLSWRLASLVWSEGRAFLAASESIGRVPGMRGVYCRQAFYRHTLAACGRDVYIGWSSVFSMTEARVGEGVYIGRRCGIGFADIGANAMLADGVQVLSGGREHGRAESTGELHQDQPQEFSRVTIGRGAWIGTNAVVMADIGEGSGIGAGAALARTTSHEIETLANPRHCRPSAEPEPRAPAGGRSFAGREATGSPLLERLR